MELAVNQFNKGLQTDTHPMVQSNDTLSDALNATFVTMNGNEVVLQNDMGNRRVDNAYLPSGYEPVGIKEYGGIIYIAAYNPITNRSLIGSFPSPERRISSNDDGTLGGNLNLSVGEGGFKTYPEDSLGGLTCLLEDTILIPLTKDTSLHAGDKFIVYNKSLTLNNKTITNYENLNDKEDKVYSPKNKCYTLALGILNSQNEFVDITSSLVRWNENDIMNLEGRSDLYKFNAGYFIKSSEPEETLFGETIQDTLLNKERDNDYQVYEANTYSYKLVGPLYLQAKINHITDFSYNIFGTYDGNSAEIYVEGIITYNCPDECDSNDGGDDNYKTYNEGLVDTSLFDFIVGNSTYNTVDKCTKCKYDPSTNLYTVKLVLKITGLTGDNGIIDYVIGVKVNTDIDKVYLQGLSSKGTLDLNKLGSGEIELKGWRFINNYKNKTGTITYTLDAYPKIGKRFKNLKLQFENVEAPGSNKYTFTSEQVNNGKTNINVEWNPETWTQGNNNGDLLYDRALYKVTFMVSEVDDVNMWSGYSDLSPNNGVSNAPGISGENNNSSTPPSKIISKTGSFGNNPVEFYLTTELFNSCYSSKTTNSDFVVDYGYPRDKDNENEKQISEIDANNNTCTGEQAVMAKKLLVGYDINTNVNDISEDANLEIDSKILVDSDSNDSPHIKYTTSKDIKLLLEETISFKEELYPSWITLSNSGIQINYSNSESTVDTDVFFSSNGDISEYNEEEVKQPLLLNLSFRTTGLSLGVHRGLITGKLSYVDNLITGKSGDIVLKDCHTEFDKTFDYFTEDMNYAGIFPDLLTDVGDIRHNLEAWVLYDKKGLGNCYEGELAEKLSPIDGYDSSDWTESALNRGAVVYNYIDEAKGDENSFTFYMTKYYNKMIDFFNSSINDKTIFTWLYNTKHCGKTELSLYYAGDESTEFHYQVWIGGNSIIPDNMEEPCNDRLYARIWWRTTNNSWALIPNTPCNYNGTFTNTTREVGDTEFINLEKDVIKKCIGNPHFAFYKEITASELNKLGPDSTKYKYNNRYNLNITLNWKEQLLLNPLNINDDYNNLLRFKLPQLEKAIDLSYTLIFESNEKFLDAVNNIIEGSGQIANIDIDCGLSIDIKGNSLLPGRVYDYETGKGLVPRTGKNIVVDDNYDSNHRALLYSGSNLSSGSPRYDQVLDSRMNTIINYDSLITVQNVK